MANLYGVANAPTVAVAYTGQLTGNIAIPASVTTTFFTTAALVAPSAGYFFPAVWASLVIQNTASINTGMVMTCAIGGGSQVSICNVGGNGLTPSGSNFISFFGFGATSQVAWQGAGSVLNIGLFSGTNPCTIWQNSTVNVLLMRAPDQ